MYTGSLHSHKIFQSETCFLLRLGNRKHMDIQDIDFSHSKSLFFVPVRSVEDPGFWPGLFQSCSTDLKQELNR